MLPVFMSMLSYSCDRRLVDKSNQRNPPKEVPVVVPVAKETLLIVSNLTYSFQILEDKRVNPLGNPPGAWDTQHEWST